MLCRLGRIDSIRTHTTLAVIVIVSWLMPTYEYGLFGEMGVGALQ